MIGVWDLNRQSFSTSESRVCGLQRKLHVIQAPLTACRRAISARRLI